MKKIIVLIILLISVKGFGQREFARINASNEFANVYKNKSIDSQVVTKINAGQLFYCAPSSEDW